MALYYAAATATAIAGLLHLMLGPNNLGFNVNQGILFIVGGIAQVFWIIPIVRRWGTPWYAIGIGGTAVFMALFLITRMPGNPITGRGGGANPLSIAVEVFEAAFIGLAAAIIVYENRMMKRLDEKSPTEVQTRKNKKHVAILAGLVVVLVLAGLFVLPMTMQRPMGGPPGQGGPPGTGQFGQQQGQQSLTQLVGSTNQTCTLTPSLVEVEGTPQQTEGPYFVDGMPNRSDITTDTSSGSVQSGIPLNLVINVYDMDDGSCVPLSGAQVDIWHADSQGVYSGVLVQGTSRENFLRGYQITDRNGTAHFNTVYPGWYEGRAIHMHIKVRTFEGSQEAFEWTSQFYLPDSTNEQVHTQPPYSNHGPVEIENEEDGIYTGALTDGRIQSNTGQHLMLNLTDQDQGYIGTFNVILDTNHTGV
jgi:protocatechuate 3,4-dioxygenase beta subunit